MNDPGVLYGLLSLILGVALYVWVGLSLSAVFEKAGEEGWQAWVPIYNVVVLLRLGGLSGLLVLLVLIPIAGWLALWVVLIMAYQRIGRAFGLGPGMTVLAALLFPVWSSIVGWGTATWVGVQGSGPRRVGDAAPALDSRLQAPYGAAQPAYATPPAYGVPPRPPAPSPIVPGPAPAAAAATPSSPAPAHAPAASMPLPAPAPAATSPAAAAPEPALPLDVPIAPAPTFRSNARAAVEASDADEPLADGDEDDLLLGRSHAPFTQTVPTSFTPSPDDGPPPAEPRRAFAPQPGEAPPPVSPFTPVQAPPAAPASAAGPPAPVQSVPPAPAAPPASEPWAPPVSDDVPAVAARPTRYSPAPEGDAYFETSAEVSAVAGAPRLGEPRSARESVSAQHGDRQIPDAESAFDETILAARRRPAFMLTPPLGAPIAVTSDILIIGRRPGTDPEFPDAQLVPVSDETRTMSKTHARLELRAGEWMIVDLDSTNGVILIGDDGIERDAAPGVSEPLTERFLLGDAELRLTRSETQRFPGASRS